MQFRNLGRSGLRVSLVGLGCNNFGGRIDLEAARKVVDAAIEHGITLFDTADIYGNRGGSELALGELLGARRKDIVLASKFGMNMDDAGVKKGGSRRYIVEAVEASLKPGHVSQEFVALEQAKDKSLDDIARHEELKAELANRFLRLSAIDVYAVRLVEG